MNSGCSLAHCQFVVSESGYRLCFFTLLSTLPSSLPTLLCLHCWTPPLIICTFSFVKWAFIGCIYRIHSPLLQNMVTQNSLDVHFYSFQQSKATAQLWIDRCTMITSLSINVNVKVSDLHQVVLKDNGADHLKSLGRPKQSGHITDRRHSQYYHTQSWTKQF